MSRVEFGNVASSGGCIIRRSSTEAARATSAVAGAPDWPSSADSGATLSALPGAPDDAVGDDKWRHPVSTCHSAEGHADERRHPMSRQGHRETSDVTFSVRNTKLEQENESPDSPNTPISRFSSGRQPLFASPGRMSRSDVPICIGSRACPSSTRPGRLPPGRSRRCGTSA